MSYYDLSILEIVHARSLRGYREAIRFMLNHELGKEPRQIGLTKSIKMARELGQVHTRLKEFHPQRNKELNRQIAQQSYEHILDKYILNEPG